MVNAGSAGKPKHGNPKAVYHFLELGERVTGITVEVAYDYARAAEALVELDCQRNLHA